MSVLRINEKKVVNLGCRIMLMFCVCVPHSNACVYRETILSVTLLNRF